MYQDPPCAGENISSVRHELAGDVQDVVSTYEAFAALKTNGSVVVWCGEAQVRIVALCIVQRQLTSTVQSISSTHFAFAALKVDGSILSWGN